MVQWRQLGVVPDSDDDGSLSDLELANDSKSSIAEAFAQQEGQSFHEEASLNQFGENERLVSNNNEEERLHIQTEPQPPLEISALFSSVPSSPLSDVQESLIFEQSPTGFGNELLLDSHRTSQENQSNHQSNRTGSYDTTSIAVEQLNGRRSLRQRHPIQLHPYLLENEIYRQSLRGRGLRPVAISDQANQSHDSQYEANDQLIPNESNDNPNSFIENLQWPTRSSSDDNLAITEPASDQRSVDEELPSLADLLQNREPNAGEYSRKKRKIAHHEPLSAQVTLPTKSAQRVLSPTTPSMLHSPNFNVNAEPIQRSTTDVHQVSHSSKPKRRLRRFRMPKEDQGALPTPSPSSDIGRAGTTVVTVNSDSESSSAPTLLTKFPRTIDESLQKHQNLDVAFENNVPSYLPAQDSTSSDESEQIHTVQRRIRGVLPASWLRIDQHVKRHSKLSGPTDRGGHKVDQPTSENKKGVAKRIQSTVSGPAQPQRWSPDKRLHLSQVLDESETASIDASQSPRFQRAAFAERSDELSAEGYQQDIEEEDWVDPMIPGPTRSRNGQKDSKRQLRLGEAVPRRRAFFNAADIRSPRQQKDDSYESHERKSSQRKTKSKPKPEPHFSIHDAARSTSRRTMPDFIRVALRQTSSRADRGRHGPSVKSLSMHRDEDNLDLYEALKHWKNGSIESLSSYAFEPQTFRSPQRNALRPRSHNQQRPTSRNDPQNKSPDKRKPKNSRAAPIQRHKGKLDVYFQNDRGGESEGKLSSKSDPVPPYSNPAEERRARPTFPTFHRPGQLETTQTLDSFLHDESAQSRRGLKSNRSTDAARPSHLTMANPLLKRYLREENRNDANEINANDVIGPQEVDRTSPIKLSQPQTRRKRAPKALNVASSKYLRLKSPDLNQDEDRSTIPMSTARQAEYLSGLGPYGTKYTTDFNIKPLPIGMFFHTSTFIGSGQLDRAINLGQRNLEQSAAPVSLRYDSKEFHLGTWTSEASDALDGLYSAVSNSLEWKEYRETEETETVTTHIFCAQSSISQALRSVIEYYSMGLSFADSIDRSLFVSRTSDRLEQLLQHFNDNEQISAKADTSAAIVRLKIKVLTFLAVISFVNIQIAMHQTVSDQIKRRVHDIFRKHCFHLIGFIVTNRAMEAIHNIAKDLQHPRTSELEVGDSHAEVEAVVVMFNLMDATSLVNGFWEMFDASFRGQQVKAFSSLQSFERVWSAIFSLLPLQEFDQIGVVRPGKRMSHSDRDWTIIKKLTERMLDLYSASSGHHTATINSYVRAVLSRYLILVERWGWYRCETVLGMLFDFFAKRNLTSLPGEDYRHQPEFLQELDKRLSSGVQLSDRSFDIFLKMLATGLQRLSALLPAKKLHNLAWRFLPNHGRNHSKENELQESDLDALRNHHNLLCVLYCASPAGHRINLDMIQNLVDFSTSHSEVCRLNARTWANLVRFQLSTNEGVCSIDPFVSWLQTMLNKSMIQHRQARSEAEAMFNEVNTEVAMTHDILESTIASNEKQVEHTLTIILGLLISVLKDAKHVEMAIALVESSSIGDLVFAYQASKTRFSKVIAMVLEVYLLYLDLFVSQCVTASSKGPEQSSNDDSQDYGEWHVFDETGDDAMENASTKTIAPSVTEALQYLLSNCFGAEGFYEETLLSKVVVAWVTHCDLQVRLSRQDWGQFLDRQGSNSWYSLRDTEQTRQYTSYFFAMVLKKDDGIFDITPYPFLSTWIVSLADRGSMLKFQHTLTNELLNAGTEHFLLHNLPFCRNKKTLQYEVSLQDIRERRIGLLSTIFSNMRTTVDGSESTSSVRHECSTLLKDLMSAMRRNYEEVQRPGSNSGAYVEFVQRIVELLQQYTSDICSIQKFFTDPAAFPLPATDPTYVVGRLKSYGLKLSDRSMQKQLVTFFQSVCERAAVDCQQEYLIDQIVKSQSHVQEHVQDRQPTLRRFLVQFVLPQYIEVAHQGDCGWILAIPILKALRDILSDLIFHFTVSDKSLSDIVMQMCSELLRSLRITFFASPLDSTLQRASTILILSSILRCTEAALPVIDYLHRSWNNGHVAIHEIFNLYHASNAIVLAVRSVDEEAFWPEITNPWVAEEPSKPSNDSVRAFCARELRDALSQRWSYDGGQYYVWHGGSRKKVTVNIRPLEVEKLDLLAATDSLKMTMAGLPVFAACLPRDAALDGSLTSALSIDSRVANNKSNAARAF